MAKQIDIHLTRRESQIMDILHRRERATVEEIRAEMDRYPNSPEFAWIQEEPANQGAWPRFGLELPELLPRLRALVGNAKGED